MSLSILVKQASIKHYLVGVGVRAIVRNPNMISTAVFSVNPDSIDANASPFFLGGRDMRFMI